mmetsp:Transcript_359/g.1187  ORF Transcript_359/g.1187 Transcript_359/m.1187 type:complete len:260 (+) Transcript_359:1546-2325(+)
MSTSFCSSTITFSLRLCSASSELLSCCACSLVFMSGGTVAWVCLCCRSALRSFLSATSLSLIRLVRLSCSCFCSVMSPRSSMSSFAASALCMSASSPSRSSSLWISPTARSFCSIASLAFSSVPAVRLCSSLSSFSFWLSMLFCISCSRILSSSRLSCTLRPFRAFRTTSLCLRNFSGMADTFCRFASSLALALCSLSISSPQASALDLSPSTSSRTLSARAFSLFASSSSPPISSFSARICGSSCALYSFSASSSCRR